MKIPKVPTIETDIARHNNPDIKLPIKYPIKTKAKPYHHNPVTLVNTKNITLKTNDIFVIIPPFLAKPTFAPIKLREYSSAEKWKIENT